MLGGGKQKESYYDILNVSSNCSEKDIKNAYVKLSKQYHPDVKGSASDQQQTARFVKISEAYQTLSKAKSRKEYDEILRVSKNTKIYDTSRSMRTEVHRPWEIKPDYDPNPGPYYGVKGVNRISNFKVAAALTALGIVGGILSFFSVRQSFKTNRKNLDDISAKANEHHRRIREQVLNSTKEEQLKRVLDRIAAHQPKE